MREDPENLDDPSRVGNTLARISDALGIPVAAFRGRGCDPDVREQLQRRWEAQVLALVKAYLQDADCEARRRFAEAVQTMAEAKARQS